MAREKKNARAARFARRGEKYIQGRSYSGLGRGSLDLKVKEQSFLRKFDLDLPTGRGANNHTDPVPYCPKPVKSKETGSPEDADLCPDLSQQRKIKKTDPRGANNHTDPVPYCLKTVRVKRKGSPEYTDPRLDLSQQRRRKGPRGVNNHTDPVPLCRGLS